MKNFLKFKKNHLLAFAVLCPMLLTGAKAWVDPAALPDALNCENGACCAHCIEVAGGMGPEKTIGWEWKLRAASHYNGPR
jgi:hypothetical protein